MVQKCRENKEQGRRYPLIKAADLKQVRSGVILYKGKNFKLSCATTCHVVFARQTRNRDGEKWMVPYGLGT